MSIPLEEAMAFALAQGRGVLATLRQDGRPQLSNIVFAAGGVAAVRMSVTADRAKTANLRRDPRAALHVTRPDFGAYAVLDGVAELAPPAADPSDDTVEELVDVYRAVSGEHPDWDEFRAAMVAQRRLVLTLRIGGAYGTVGA